MRSVRIHESGGPEVLRLDDLDLPELGPERSGTDRSAGVNFIDTYHRDGKYPLDLPATIGVEAGGVVHAVGPDVKTASSSSRSSVCASPSDPTNPCNGPGRLRADFAARRR